MPSEVIRDLRKLFAASAFRSLTNNRDLERSRWRPFSNQQGTRQVRGQRREESTIQTSMLLSRPHA